MAKKDLNKKVEEKVEKAIEEVTDNIIDAVDENIWDDIIEKRSKELGEKMGKKIVDKAKDAVKGALLEEAIDFGVDALKYQDSINFGIQKSDLFSKNYLDTLKITGTYLEELSKTEEVTLLAREKSVAQGRENLRDFSQAIADLGQSMKNAFMIPYKYVKHFWDFGKDSKTFLVLRKEAVSSVLQTEIEGLEEQKRLNEDLIAQRNRELAQLDENKKKHEQRIAGNDKFFKAEQELGAKVAKQMAEQEVDWEKQREDIWINFASNYQKLNKKEFDLFLKYGEEGLQNLINKYQGGADDIEKAYATTQHKGNYGLDDDQREYGYHTNTHEDQLKAMQGNYQHMANLLTLIKEIGVDVNSVLNETNTAVFTTQENLSQKTETINVQQKKMVKESLESEEERFDRLEVLQIRAESDAQFKESLQERVAEGIKAQEAIQIQAIDKEKVLLQQKKDIQEESQSEQLESIESNNQEVEQAEADSHKTRAEQWKEYAEKVSAISQQISEVTGMVTSSLGGMFGQLAESYSQQVEELTNKISALDEEKEAALERVSLSEEERSAKEEELAQQKIDLEYATSEEQKNKADERIATLQGELGAEDSINRDFESKKASLEKEKAKKEKEQQKAEKMQKRLQMGQAIVEAVGNIAQGAAKALAMGPILGPILAAVVSAAGAMQVGIMTKQLAKMEDGGLLNGKRHSQGGMRILGSNIEVEGGEYVMNRQTTQKNLGLIEYINSQRKTLDTNDINSYFGQPFSMPTFSPSPFAEMMKGDQVVPMLSPMDSVDTKILNAIEKINFQPRVSVTDINTVHDNMVKVDEWTGL